MSNSNLLTLKISAGKSARKLGHSMTQWINHNDGHSATAVCRKCTMSVSVDTAPPPNGIDISGEAIALECQGLDHALQTVSQASQHADEGYMNDVRFGPPGDY